jgi:hypothetical protein
MSSDTWQIIATQEGSKEPEKPYSRVVPVFDKSPFNPNNYPGPVHTKDLAWSDLDAMTPGFG